MIFTFRRSHGPHTGATTWISPGRKLFRIAFLNHPDFPWGKIPGEMNFCDMSRYSLVVSYDFLSFPQAGKDDISPITTCS